jgi:(S)-ureidoglycine aminohydrolase
MKKLLLLIVLSIPILAFAQLPVVSSKMYSWKEPTSKTDNNIASAVLFEGSVHDLQYLQMSANAITAAKKKVSLEIPGNEEHLLIVKNGTLIIGFKDSTWSIGRGSVALLMPGEKYALQNKTADACTFYRMKYRSKLPMDLARGQASGGSFVKDWNKIPFKPHDRGGIRNYFEKKTSMSKRFEMHVTTLKEGIKSHEPHTHRAEEIVLVIDNKTEMQMDDKFYKGGTGDIYYLGCNVSHAIRNDGTGTCTYFAFQFE